MKKIQLQFSVIFCFFFICTSNIIRSQTGCDLAAIRAAFSAEGHYTELTGVTGQPCSMYFINTTSQDADLSESQAQLLGAHMAVFNTAAENTAVVNAIYASYSGNIWIGYKRSGAGASSFYAMDGTTGDFEPAAATGALYQNWAGGEPNNTGYQSCGAGCAGSIFIPCTNVERCENGEQCTQVYSDGKWNDLPCNSSSISVVEVNLCPQTTITPSSLSICGGGSVSLPTATVLGSAPYTYNWTSVPAGFTSSSANPTASPSVNTTYYVTATDRYGCTSQAEVLIQVTPISATISGINGATCTGTCDGSATATASGGIGTGAYSYSWNSSPIQTTATATGLCAGTYICTVGKGDCEPSGAELVANSDFSAGNTGFTSTYGYVADGAGNSELNPEGKYSVVNGNASQVHGSFTGTGRGGGGSFMVINGASTANTSVWCETITIIPNTDYVFSAWLSTMYTTSPAMLQFSFNGVNTGSIFNAPSVTGQWDQFFQSWNSGPSSTVDICVVNQNTATSGNDFALDDISFKLCTPSCQDTAMVVIPDQTVSVDPITPSTICASGSATLTAVASGGNGTYTYTWSPAVTGSGSTVTASPAVTTTYTLNVSDGNGCAGAPVEVTVTVNNVLTVTVNSASLCFAESATLMASGAATYSWSPATDLDVSSGATVVCTPTMDRTYTVTGSSGGCVGTAIATVTINPTPNSEAGADISICSGTTGTIGAASSPGYIYSWLPATDLDDASVANPMVSPINYSAAPVTIEYIVTTSPAGCFSTDTVMVTVDPSTDPSFNYSSSTFCQAGGGANPSPTITSMGGTFSFTPAGLSMDANSGLIDLALSTLGTYTVTYTHGGACPSSSSATVTITNVPNADFSYGIYCQNDADPLPAFISGASAGLFTAASGLVFVDDGTGELNLAGSTVGTYTVTNTISSSGGCPNAVGSNTITITAVPNTTIDNQTICVGDTAILTAVGASTYSWSDGSSLATLSVSPPSTTSYTVTGNDLGCFSSATGTVYVNALPMVVVNDATVCGGLSATLKANGADTYLWSEGSIADSLIVTPVTTTNYTVTGTLLGCKDSAISTVTTNPIPVVSVNDPAICLGNTATMIAMGADTYVWSDGSTAGTLAVSPSNNTTYTVTGTSLGCSSFDEATVTITALPNVQVNSPDVCAGDTATLTASGGSSYVWSTGVAGSSIMVTPSGNTSYTVSDTTAGCSGSAVSVVTVNPLPVISLSDATICEGEKASITPVGANAYAWSNGSTGTPFIVSPITTTTYTVIGTSSEGCKATDVLKITVNPRPDVIVNSQSICQGLTTTLTASGANSYTWSNGGTGTTITVSPPSTSLSYSLTVTGSSVNGCTDDAIGMVTLFKKPTAQFSTSPNSIRLFDPVVGFNDQSSRDVNYWFWSFGDGDTLAPDDPNPIHAYPGDTATYMVTLKVHNAGFCYDSINHLVLIGPEYSFYIPTAFTPDGDGINDTFFGKGVGILEYDLRIFDRWGDFIFYTSDLDTGWDGKANGGENASQQDIYVWKVSLRDIYKKEHNYTGTVTVVRGQ